MANDFKISAYVIAAVCVAASFFYNLRPYLLLSPPNPFVLAMLAVAGGLLLFSVVIGPVLVLMLPLSQRKRMRRIFRLAFWVFVAGGALGFLFSYIPVIVPIGLLCFGIAAFMLSGVTFYKPKQLVVAGG